MRKWYTFSSLSTLLLLFDDRSLNLQLLDVPLSFCFLFQLLLTRILDTLVSLPPPFTPFYPSFSLPQLQAGPLDAFEEMRPRLGPGLFLEDTGTSFILFLSVLLLTLDGTTPTRKRKRPFFCRSGDFFVLPSSIPSS